MTSRWWCELAWLGDGPDATPAVLLEVDGSGRFESVAPGASPDGAVRLSGLTLPGLVNAHSHAFHRVLRGRTQDSDSFWSWRDRMYEVAGRLDPDSYLQLATAVFAEMALAGITTVGEFHYLHHGPGGVAYTAGDPMAAAIIEAAATAGLRLTLLDACYLAGGLGTAAAIGTGSGTGTGTGTELDAVQRRFSDGSAERWAARVESLAGSDTVRIGAAIHSVRAVPADAVPVVVAWASERAAPLHAHVSEQPAENEACLKAYGQTPTDLLASLGALGPNFTAVHATHLTHLDIELLGSSASSVCMCPTTERELADGIGPAAALRTAGSPLCLGSDSHAVINLFEEARAVELDERLATGRRGHHSPADLLGAATAGGAAALGWPDAGRLRPGALADFVTVRAGGPSMSGATDDRGGGAAAAAVFCATPADVTDVVVGGRHVVAGGQHQKVADVGRSLTKAIARVLAG